MTPNSFTEVVAAGLVEFAGLAPSQAETLASAIAGAAAKTGRAGSYYYLPHALTREDRDAAIRREFNGQNLHHICIKFGVHRTTVYRAVKRHTENNRIALL
jgi:Mor family transcriptional regulator